MADGGSVFIPWYATGFRADDLAEALAEIGPIAMRYGAIDHAIYRSRDDRYRFTQIASFESKDDFERYWYGEDFSRWRSQHAGWYQVPVLYVWNDRVAAGALQPPAPTPNA
jgi:hypothetical protein